MQMAACYYTWTACQNVFVCILYQTRPPVVFNTVLQDLLSKSKLNVFENKLSLLLLLLMEKLEVVHLVAWNKVLINLYGSME